MEIAHLVELDDVGVADLFENLDLPCDSFHILLVLDAVFLEDLDGDL